jgi:hypothetical protein
MVANQYRTFKPKRKARAIPGRRFGGQKMILKLFQSGHVLGRVADGDGGFLP